MDVKACLDILHERSKALQEKLLSSSSSDHICSNLESLTCLNCQPKIENVEDQYTGNDPFEDMVKLYSNIDLVNLFSTLQGERVQVE